MNELFTKKNIRFAIVAILYILVVIWIGNYWFLIGLAVVYDLYISEKVNWTFWKKRNAKNSAIIEWLDALIFAVIAVSLINILPEVNRGQISSNGLINGLQGQVKYKIMTQLFLIFLPGIPYVSKNRLQVIMRL